MSPASKGLTQRDADALNAIGALDARSSRAARLAISRLSWDQWRRAVASLVADGYVVQEQGERATGQPDSLTLTAKGRGVWRSPQVRHTPPQVTATRPESSLSLKSLDPEEKKEEREEARPPQGGVAPQVAALMASLNPALVARVALALEAALKRYAAEPVPAVERCACGRGWVTLKGPFGEYRGCPAKKRCPYYEPPKAKAEGPRISPAQSEKARQARAALPRGPVSVADTLKEIAS